MSQPLTGRPVLLAWVTRNALATLDQGVFAGGNFILNVLLARWLGAEAYGAFAVGFVTFLFLAGLYNALILEPATVLGSARHFDAIRQYFRKQTVLHFSVTVALAGGLALLGSILVLLEKQSPVGAALIGAGIALPFLLLFWLARRLLYILRRPFDALLGSTAYLLLTVTGTVALLRHSILTPFSAFILMACASLISSLGMFWRANLTCRFEKTGFSSSAIQVFRENWGYGRWLVGGTLLFSIANQSQIFLCAAFLGVDAAGALRALQLPSLVIVNISTAMGTLALPEIARACGRGDIRSAHRKGCLVSGVLLFLAVILEVSFVWKYVWLENSLFDGIYAEDAWVIPILGLLPVFAAFANGPALVLRAVEKPKFELFANSFSGVVGIAALFLLIGPWGLEGVATSMVLGSLAAATLTLYLYTAWVPWRLDSNVKSRTLPASSSLERKSLAADEARS